jgi:hypothetical protein
LTESEFLKGPGADAIPRVFSEADFKFSNAEEVLYQRLTPDGTIRGKEPGISPALLRRLYEQMVFGRVFDEKASNLSLAR